MSLVLVMVVPHSTYIYSCVQFTKEKIFTPVQNFKTSRKVGIFAVLDIKQRFKVQKEEMGVRQKKNLSKQFIANNNYTEIAEVEQNPG